MNPEKIGDFIKKLRIDNNLTQKDLADKYGVTYQAVSKWENGKNLPDISLLKEMSKDFNVSIEELLDGKLLIKDTKKKTNKLLIISIILFSIAFTLLLIYFIKNYNSISFRTISSNCKEFNVTGSIVYNSNKSYIYISNINYCGSEDKEAYKSIECSLYETNGNSNIKIEDCVKKDNINLDDYLKDLQFKIDDYKQACKKYTDDSLHLEIRAYDDSNKIITYNIPLNIEDDC